MTRANPFQSSSGKKQSSSQQNHPTGDDEFPEPTTGSGFNMWAALQSVFSVAIVIATLFTMWNPSNIFSNQMLDRMFKSSAYEPVKATSIPLTPTPSPRPRIGIVAGHWGNDSGAVCQDGLTEVELNQKIATLVRDDLINEGYDVDLLTEKDERLFEYTALALVSIHNDSCDYINNDATGFKVAAAMSSVFPEKASRLTACLVDRYGSVTNMKYHPNTITKDMTNYHTFNEIHSETTAAIIETGFMNLDRQILTEHTDLIARGISQGVLCFIRNEDLNNKPTQEPTP
ncbi:MAG: N-acetylmuramoyl-L-alanine amidase [Leptolinea sp.]|jgi:N-acetylmuramoyl-L-alanine amidase|nr:N-acetylmuramoyl-L-alanine amidase [Leptolinea sp.]